jgi:hypothetical protein
MQRIFSLAFVIVSLTAITLASSSSTIAQEEFTGTVVGVGGTLGGVSRPFTLKIESQTAPDERTRAVSVLAEDGQDGLLKLIGGKKLGFFSMGSQLGRDLNFVQVTSTADGGRHYVILFERWMNLYELRYGTRSQDYPFSFVELFIDASGKGEGSFIPAARVRFNKGEGNLEVENFGIYPARLSGVKLRNKN